MKKRQWFYIYVCIYVKPKGKINGKSVKIKTKINKQETKSKFFCFVYLGDD